MSQLFIQLCICVHSSGSTSTRLHARDRISSRSLGLRLFVRSHLHLISVEAFNWKIFLFLWWWESILFQLDVSLHEPINTDAEQTMSNLKNNPRSVHTAITETQAFLNLWFTFIWNKHRSHCSNKLDSALCVFHPTQPECNIAFWSLHSKNHSVKHIKNNIHKHVHGWLETHHHQVLGNPAVRGEVLQHGDQELETAVPVTQQQHHTNQVHYPHHGTGKVIGHMEDLKRSRGKETEVNMVARR